MDKKANMEYWDNIDHLTEEYVKELIKFSQSKVDDIYDEGEDMVMHIAKEITDFAIHYLEDVYKADFPYVEGNY